MLPVLIGLGCTAEDALPTDPVDTEDPLEALRLPELFEVNGDHAATSELCFWCHANTTRSDAMRDAEGSPVSPWDLWRGSMMALSSRDPFFRAAVAAEQAAFPDHADEIGQDCMRCHAPAAFAEASLTGQELPGAHAVNRDDVLGRIALDGTTCVGCHMLDPSRSGGPETWSGQHAYDEQRRLYGPHEQPFASPMQGFAEYTPTFHEDYGASGQCASCHMLQTDALDADGTPTGHTLTEQAPFVEWRSSAFAGPDGATCQQCHLPRTGADGQPIETRIARSSGGFDSSRLEPRQPYGKHLIVGGNAFALEVMHEHRGLLGLAGPSAAMLQAIDATRANLASSASLSFGEAVWDGSRVQLPITVVNHVGHKLPTGYPARRAWLEVSITDATGTSVLHIGAVDARGRLIDADGAPLPSEAVDGPLEPHRDRITGADTPQIWQSWMQDVDGRPTTRLLGGATFAKDDRLLPAGFAPSPEDAALVAPVGVDDDADFVAGGDTVHLDASLDGTPPFQLQATLRYQAWSPRSLDALTAVETPETRGLRAMLQGRGVPAETLATASATLSP